MKTWHVIVGLLLTWIVLMMHMSTNVLNSGEGSSRMEQQLVRIAEKLDLLHFENKDVHSLVSKVGQQQGNEDQGKLIQELRSQLQKATDDLQKLSDKQPRDHPGSPGRAQGLTLEHERARRKAENTATELWYFVNAQMEKLAQESGSANLVKNFHADLRGYQAVLMDDLKALREADGGEDWRLKESLKLGDLVQRRLKYLQNPKDCSTAKFILCDFNARCGYGCQLHHATYCLLVAYNTQRTLVLNSKGWNYAVKGWESAFMPLSDTCTEVSETGVRWTADKTKMESARVIRLPIVGSMTPRPEYMPQAIPEDLAPRLTIFHGDPPVWWMGQFVRYLMRPNEDLRTYIKARAEKMGFDRPIVGVHIRRTDKIGTEASYHSLDEYMRHVDAYFNQREHQETIQQRRVYLATDDPTILGDARKRYSNYEFISDNEISQSAGLKSRYTDQSLWGIISDMHFLSVADFIVCTFSSQICRAAYELMQTMHGDASSNVHSLDDVYYFAGQNDHNFRVVEPHGEKDQKEISFEVNDLVHIAGNHWDGYSKGRNRKTTKIGLYPSYKVVNEFVSVKMPTYPEVKEEDEGEGV